MSITYSQDSKENFDCADAISELQKLCEASHTLIYAIK